MERYVKINSEPIEIEYVEDEHEESRDFEPSFWWNNQRHYLDDFFSTHNDAWCDATVYPDYIHGYEYDNYYNPLYIELVDDTAVNVYRRVESEHDV